MTECPYCGCDPYEYVDVGVGSAPVAVTCCELGIEVFSRNPSDEVTISRGQFDAFTNVFVALRTLGMTPEMPA
ncbi:hypothetical protein [Ahrensia sp. R2A130]|uniref:hypothetical protein n=1 Tax=Ahrensia sp. R2A130 TaxID=744979 RepID=UPI0001E0BCC0|nr:hypothetical protein [Ahrensia sp. R2A130]EFL88328.1 conserved hypothetical protein [Ahrensia sp. R2A130]